METKNEGTENVGTDISPAPVGAVDNRPPDKPARNLRPAITWLLHLVQPACLTVALLLLAYLLMNSVIFLEDEYGSARIYNLWDNTNISANNADTFEDSELFRELLEERVTNVIEVGGIRLQLEPNGSYDVNETIDINAAAYSHTKTHYPQKYVRYRLGDLIKWAEQGFLFSEVYNTEQGWVEFWGNDYTLPTPRSWYEETFTDEGGEVEFVDVVVPEGNSEAQPPINIDKYLREYSYLSNHPYNFGGIDNFAREGFFVYDSFTDDVDQWVVLEDGTETPMEYLWYALAIKLANDPQNSGLIYPTPRQILENSFQTVEGKNLEAYASSFAEYNWMLSNLQQTAVDLRSNYERYQEASRVYEGSNSNIYYIIRTKNGPSYSYLHNLPPGAVQNQDFYTIFRENTDKYLYYNTSDWSYETNTSVDESYVRNVFRVFADAYPDNVELWIGVDTAYPANDVFAQGSRGYRAFSPNLEPYIIAIVICLFLYVALFFVLSVLTGWQVDGRLYATPLAGLRQTAPTADGTRRTAKITRLWGFDHVFTEIWLALAVVIFGTLGLVAWEIASNANILKWLVYNRPGLFLPLFGLGVFAVGLLFGFFFYSIVRRIKAKSWWRDSLLYRLWRLIWWACRKAGGFSVALARKGKAAAVFFYENLGLIGRFALPVAGVLVAHLILLVFMMAFASSGAGALFFVLLILAIDAAVIYVLLRAAKARATVVAGVDKICGGDLSYKVEETGLSGDNLALAKAINQIGEAVSSAVETSRRDERMKAELITNVSHDIKTPLTSIINYIDLIQRESIADETIKGYVDILEAKSQRLKQLTDDLVEISKISSGNIVLQLEKINLTELVNQMVGEFSEKYAAKSLQFSIKASEENICIRADSRHIWRVVENLCINIHKYALAGTRVYVDIAKKESGQVALEIKNISEQPLNFTADELTERFVRGDDARSTEGSGLGLSIAKSLTEAQGGGFAIAIDGDLFKVVLSFPLLANSS